MEGRERWPQDMVISGKEGEEPVEMSDSGKKERQLGEISGSRRGGKGLRGISGSGEGEKGLRGMPGSGEGEKGLGGMPGSGEGEKKSGKIADRKKGENLGQTGRRKKGENLGQTGRRKRGKELRWDKLDNTANLFPVIAGESMSNVYRISVILKEEVQQGLLQEALEMVLPWFDVFQVRMRYGMFWYYFEANQKPAPKVKEEYRYPCQYISPNRNHNYLFRVNYYKNRINLEVFHVLTDGMGGITFLRELTYQYLRLAHPELRERLGDGLCSDTSLNREDSYLKNYRKGHKKGYKTQRAFLVKGEKLKPLELGVMHGYIPIQDLKRVCKGYGVSINEYLVAAFLWSIYQECLHGMPSKRPISSCVPVNLRPYFNSITLKNFFVIVSAVFWPKKESYCFEEVVQIVADSLRSQINREHLENLFAYNVSNEKNFILRAVPLFLKSIAMRHVYRTSALANTTTVTNIGNIQVREEYQDYIECFSSFLSMSKGQNIKGNICSYRDTLVFSISSNLADVSIQRGFFRKLSEEGISVRIETNGVYEE